MQAVPDSWCEKVFWQDPYCTRLQTHINTVDGDRVTLARTIFFASSGGQESDSGTIAGITVLDASKQGQQIYYTLPRDHALAVGQAVEISIDWHRRYRLMRLHLAAEIPIRPTVETYPLADANRALTSLKREPVKGAKVLVVNSA